MIVVVVVCIYRLSITCYHICACFYGARHIYCYTVTGGAAILLLVGLLGLLYCYAVMLVCYYAVLLLCWWGCYAGGAVIL